MADFENADESISLSDAILLLDSPSSDEIDQLARYEQMFSQRFTQDDSEFMKVLKAENPTQPCVENWYSRPKRNFDWSRGNSERGRGGGHRGYDREAHGDRGYKRPWNGGGHDDGRGGKRHQMGGDYNDRRHDGGRDHGRGNSSSRVHYVGVREGSNSDMSSSRSADNQYGQR